MKTSIEINGAGKNSAALHRAQNNTGGIMACRGWRHGCGGVARAFIRRQQRRKINSAAKLRQRRHQNLAAAWQRDNGRNIAGAK